MKDYLVSESVLAKGKYYICARKHVRPHASKRFLWPDGKWHSHTTTMKDWMQYLRSNYPGAARCRRPGYFDSREAAEATLARYLKRTGKTS